MAKTDFEIRSILDATITSDVFEWRDAAVASVAAERDALADKLRDIELKLDDPDASKDDVKAEKEKTAKQRQRQALRDELDKINVSKVEVQAKLDALDAKAGGAGK